jgi:hypothetical protein
MAIKLWSGLISRRTIHLSLFSFPDYIFTFQKEITVSKLKNEGLGCFSFQKNTLWGDPATVA